MPIYEYKALTDLGETRNGILDADTPRDARDKLRAQALHVVALGPLKGGRKKEAKASFLTGWLRRRRLSEVSIVTRQLATLLGSGIPLADALTALIEQVESQDMEATFRDVKEKVTQGAPLAEAMANHPGYFNDLFVNMVRAGEASGALDVVLARLADYTQKQNRIKNKVSAAMAYPIMMMLVGAAVVGILMTFVVPKILTLLQNTRTALPWPTLILIQTSHILTTYGPFLLGGAFLAFIAFRALLRRPGFRLGYDRFLLRLPVLGPLFKKQAVSRFAITFSTLLKSGIPVLEALNIVKNIVDNRVMFEVIETLHNRILEGADISTPLKKSGIFPPVVGYMIAVGEQTGKLEDMLDRIATSYDEEVDLATMKMTSLIEPIMIVVLSVLVGFIVMSIIWPILEASNIKGY
jgi:general secretion pathway protein F